MHRRRPEPSPRLAHTPTTHAASCRRRSGRARSAPNERSATQCCRARSERIRVDRRGIAAAGTVTQVDVMRGRVSKVITVERHPTALAWDESHGRLYVADGNDDAVSVIDTRSD